MKFVLTFSIVIFKNKIPLTFCKRNVESTRFTSVTMALLTPGNGKGGLVTMPMEFRLFLARFQECFTFIQLFVV